MFTAAGQFLYHCSIHPVMVATVSVLPTASPASGPVGTTFTITVATVAPDTDLVYDIQKKDPGRQFQDWSDRDHDAERDLRSRRGRHVPVPRARSQDLDERGEPVSSPVSITVSA